MTDKDRQTSNLPLSVGPVEMLPTDRIAPSRSIEKCRALRERLEQIVTRAINNPTSHESATTSLEEIRQTLHELKVCQLELEFQNEELQRKQTFIQEKKPKSQQPQKLESLGALAGKLAHDFNNILGIILGQCDILNENISLGIDPIAQVKHIEKAALRAVNLCQQVLVCVGKTAPVQTRVSLRSLVEETVEQLRPTLNNNTRIDLDISDELFEITGDNSQARQAIMNLYCNAAESIGERNGTITVALNKRTVRNSQAEFDFLGNEIQDGDYACLTVADNGSGMNIETKKRLFESNYTSQLIGGGLGLSAVLGIVTSHGGALQFTTAPGEGTNFRLFFPLLDVTGIASSAPKVECPPDRKHGTLLLVDDETPLRIIGSALLKAMGFTVMIAADGREAIETYKKHNRNIELILLDLLMPGMGGIETYRLLRQISPSIPIIISSECTTENLAQDFRDDPLTETVQKPYKPDQLRNIFTKLVGTMEQDIDD